MKCTILKFVKEKGKIIGVLIQVDNGDTQYLTIKEYEKLSEKRTKF
jgi:hypothetical protein